MKRRNKSDWLNVPLVSLFMVMLIILSVTLPTIIGRNREFELEHTHETSAVIRTCDRYNICTTTEVERFEILRRGDGTMREITRVVEFERDGEVVRWRLDWVTIEVIE